MKPGLWIEPEIVGIRCEEMLNYYDDDCFLQRNGHRIAVMNRYFLDYRNEKVRAYMSETIRRMVEDYGADYIKLDYNEDLGIGTDKDSDSFGEGLEQCARAYLCWIDEMRARFPHVLFETCSSGGMRMDYETLKHFSIISTSDQVHYRNYPYIAANITASALPEQAGVWSYPVDVDLFDPNHPEKTNARVTRERVVFNMVNAMLTRIHLSCNVFKLTEQQLHEAFNASRQTVRQALQCLVDDGLISRTVYPEVPPRVEYAMTDLGRSLMPILTAIRDWGAEYLRGKDIEPNCFMMRDCCSE